MLPYTISLSQGWATIAARAQHVLGVAATAPALVTPAAVEKAATVQQQATAWSMFWGVQA